jgi:hypothetical protein
MPLFTVDWDGNASRATKNGAQQATKQTTKCDKRNKQQALLIIYEGAGRRARWAAKGRRKWEWVYLYAGNSRNYLHVETEYILLHNHQPSRILSSITTHHIIHHDGRSPKICRTMTHTTFNKTAYSSIDP